MDTTSSAGAGFGALGAQSRQYAYRRAESKDFSLEIGKDVLWIFLEGLLNALKRLDKIAVTGGLVFSMLGAWELSRPMSFLEKPHGRPHVVDIMSQCVLEVRNARRLWNRYDRQSR